MIHITTEEIKQMPVTTNRLMVTWNKDAFFDKYSIVSYKMVTKDKARKNLSYEQLSDTPSLSVVGIYAKYEAFNLYPYTRFFVLVNKGEEDKVLSSLGAYPDVASKLDNLEKYDVKLQERIIVSLALNSLGKKGKKGKKGDKGIMYNNGMLLVCDDNNFGCSSSRQELVCLKLEVNKYMNLLAKTVSFSHPKNDKDLNAHSNCVFKIGKEMDGMIWLGQPLKPVVIKRAMENGLDLNDFYVQGKRFGATHNIVPYWPIDTKKYNHGKLFVVCQMKELVNKLFEGMVHLDFADYEVLDYQEGHTEKEMLSLLNQYFSGKTILFEDTFNTMSSKEHISSLQKEMVSVVNGLKFTKTLSKADMVLRLCKPRKEGVCDNSYSKSLDRLAKSTKAIQHVTHADNPKEDKVNSSIATRILLELLVKDNIVAEKMPSAFGELLEGWTFFNYKIDREDSQTIWGASMNVGENHHIHFTQYGFDRGLGANYDTFVANTIGFHSPTKLRGSHDYKVMSKDGNVYLILDTDEIPILDVNLIDEAYGKIIEGNDKNFKTLSLFKRKKDGTNHMYLRGYMGFHIWKADGLDGEDREAYSYISGYNSDNLKLMSSTSIDKIPRVRRIFILKKKHPERVWEDIQQMKSMLLVGLGRWKEQMTYPFPFKFLNEYLDTSSEIAFSKHWSEV